MTESPANLAVKLKEQFSNELIDCVCDRGQVTLVLPTKHLLSVCKVLRDDEQFSFSQLSDLCGVDYSEYGQVDWATHETTSTGFSRGRHSESKSSTDRADSIKERFAVVYHLLSLEYNIRIRLRCFVADETPRIDSVTEICNSAN